MSLAHARQNGLFVASLHRTQFLFGAVCDAATTLYGHLKTSWGVTALAGRTMGRTKPCFFHVLIATLVLACLPFGAVRDAQASLHHAVGTSSNIALAADSFARAPRCQLGVLLLRLVITILAAANISIVWTVSRIWL